MAEGKGQESELAVGPGLGCEWQPTKQDHCELAPGGKQIKKATLRKYKFCQNNIKTFKQLLQLMQRQS